MNVSNIAACQINSDTKHYCQNVFDILYLPLEMLISRNTYNSVKNWSINIIALICLYVMKRLYRYICYFRRKLWKK